MKTKFRTLCLTMAMGMVTVLAACGDGGQAPSGDDRSSGESAEAPGGVCSLLTREQVDAVVPGNDGGREDTSLATAYKDVETEQCRYVHFEDTDMQFLDVFVYRASSDAGFRKVDISGRMLMGSPRKLDIGDISFLDDIDSRTIKVASSKGRTVFELSLNSKDAPAKSDQLINLARVLAGEL